MFEEKGNSSFVGGIGITGVKDFVGLGELEFESYPVFLLSVSFLYRDSVVVVNEFSDRAVLGFPSIFGKTLGGEKAIGIPSVK